MRSCRACVASVPQVGMSLFVSNIGSEHLVGLSGSAAASGVAVGARELGHIHMQ